MEQHLLRHADAGDTGDWDGPDELRPLSEKGKRQATRLARHLHAISYTVDVVLTSPKVRAIETARPVADALGVEIVIEPRLAASFGPSELAAMLAAAGNHARPLLVGHDPDLSAMLSLLTGSQGMMRKGALARIDVDGELEAGGGTLGFLLPPRLLPR
jgi:phosphohistidine phosphatase